KVRCGRGDSERVADAAMSEMRRTGRMASHPLGSQGSVPGVATTGRDPTENAPLDAAPARPPRWKSLTPGTQAKSSPSESCEQRRSKTPAEPVEMAGGSGDFVPGKTRQNPHCDASLS